MSNHPAMADQITSTRTAAEIRRTYSQQTGSVDKNLISAVHTALARIGLEDVYNRLLKEKLSNGVLDTQAINVLIALENGLRQGLTPDEISGLMTDAFFTL